VGFDREVLEEHGVHRALSGRYASPRYPLTDRLDDNVAELKPLVDRRDIGLVARKPVEEFGEHHIKRVRLRVPQELLDAAAHQARAGNRFDGIDINHL